MAFDETYDLMTHKIKINEIIIGSQMAFFQDNLQIVIFFRLIRMKFSSNNENYLYYNHIPMYDTM